MHRIIVITVIFLVLIFTFIPLSHLEFYNRSTEEIKQKLNLSVKVLPYCIDNTDNNYMLLAEGFKRCNTINKNKLLDEFHDVLSDNICNEKKYQEIKSGILAKVLVYYDRFYIAGRNDRWSPPYFFTCQDGERLYYVYTRGDYVYYYNSGNIVTCSLNSTGITKEQRNNIVINKLNSIIAIYTLDTLTGKGLNIKIYNPGCDSPEYKAKNMCFNVLDGITFFVVYSDSENLGLNGKKFRFSSCNVAGYTME